MLGNSRSRGQEGRRVEPGKGSFQGHRRKSYFEIITGISLAKAKHIFGEQALCTSYFLSSSAMADFD